MEEPPGSAPTWSPEAHSQGSPVTGRSIKAFVYYRLPPITTTNVRVLFYRGLRPGAFRHIPVVMPQGVCDAYVVVPQERGCVAGFLSGGRGDVTGEIGFAAGDPGSDGATDAGRDGVDAWLRDCAAHRAGERGRGA